MALKVIRKKIKGGMIQNELLRDLIAAQDPEMSAHHLRDKANAKVEA